MGGHWGSDFELAPGILCGGQHGPQKRLCRSSGPVTLGEMFKALQVDVQGLTVNALDVQADSTLWERFDYFNAKYRPMGNAHRPPQRLFFWRLLSSVHFSEPFFPLFLSLL